MEPVACRALNQIASAQSCSIHHSALSSCQGELSARVPVTLATTGIMSSVFKLAFAKPTGIGAVQSPLASRTFTVWPRQQSNMLATQRCPNKQLLTWTRRFSIIATLATLLQVSREPSAWLSMVKRVGKERFLSFCDFLLISSISGTAQISRVSLAHAVNRRTQPMAGMPVNATLTAAASHITAAKATSWLANSLLTVRLTAPGRPKNFQPVFVSTKAKPIPPARRIKFYALETKKKLPKNQSFSKSFEFPSK